MALETGTWVGDLNPANPPGTDPKSMGDDHLRLIKATERNSFAGFTGAILVTGVNGGVVNAYTLTPSTALPAYTTGMNIEFTPTITNTGASTINISALGVLPVQRVNGAPVTAGELVADTTYMATYNGAAMRLLSNTKAYVDNLAFSAALPAIPPSGPPKMLVGRNGVAAFAGGVMPRSARTANVQLTAADSGQYIDITSGTFTQTFDAVAAMQDGWYVLLKNSGTGDITLDPSGAETIDGLASFIMYPGECRAVVCDGVALFSTVVTPFSKTYTANGSFVKPPGYRQFGGIAWSGGQSGGRSNNAAANLPGSFGGGAFPFAVAAALLAASEVVTIGPGGAAVVGVASGNPGGDTSLGVIARVYGGSSASGGSVRISTAAGQVIQQTTLPAGTAVGFEAIGSTVNTAHTIYGGAAPSNNASNDSGSSLYGGAASGGLAGAVVRASGTSTFGGSAGISSVAASGTDGAPRGGAGGATHTGPASGAGGRGELQIWGIA